ncbi:MAG: argininosuccinate synthase, partial [Eggerthella lenta]
LQTLSAKTWASNRRQEGAPAELFDAQKKVGPLTKGAYADVTPVWKQVAEAENAAVVEEAEAALQGAAEKA